MGRKGIEIQASFTLESSGIESGSNDTRKPKFWTTATWHATWHATLTRGISRVTHWMSWKNCAYGFKFLQRSSSRVKSRFSLNLASPGFVVKSNNIKGGTIHVFSPPKMETFRGHVKLHIRNLKIRYDGVDRVTRNGKLLEGCKDEHVRGFNGSSGIKFPSDLKVDFGTSVIMRDKECCEIGVGSELSDSRIWVIQLPKGRIGAPWKDIFINIRSGSVGI
ncbi:hypothetical protein L6452_22096 [Arctium lappa]|uniref:Uncharacterized protein n=1 Tax=Arctium lappa TaxID=4217 RepID=A0ACB9AY95_ARCLA|nr:hypothetical protein L6452_22096 [Arctium lappa]